VEVTVAFKHTDGWLLQRAGGLDGLCDRWCSKKGFAQGEIAGDPHRCIEPGVKGARAVALCLGGPIDATCKRAGNSRPYSPFPHGLIEVVRRQLPDMGGRAAEFGSAIQVCCHGSSAWQPL